MATETQWFFDYVYNPTRSGGHIWFSFAWREIEAYGKEKSPLKVPQLVSSRAGIQIPKCPPAKSTFPLLYWLFSSGMDWPFLRLAGREIYMLFIPLKKIVSNLIREVFLKTNTHLTFSLNIFIKILWKILRVISQLFFFQLHPHILVSLPFSLNNNYYQRSLIAPLHMALKTGVWTWRNLLTQCHFISKSQDSLNDKILSNGQVNSLWRLLGKVWIFLFRQDEFSNSQVTLWTKGKRKWNQSLVFYPPFS